MLANMLEFIFITVGLKMIVGHWLAERIVEGGKKLLGSSERNSAILDHYKLQALHAGHDEESVLECTDGRCTIFKMAT